MTPLWIDQPDGLITPVYYPPWFKSYKAFRAHINQLVARKEAEVRARARRPRRRRYRNRARVNVSAAKRTE